MPSSKRKSQSAETAAAATSALKRQRVSRACDQCRSAREKCDGVQPQCFSCVTLSRRCTYNVAPKKRGVQTGLIRTLELALVWLFDQVPGTEEKLANLLAREGCGGGGGGGGGGGPSLLLDKDSDVGNRLHQRWRRCRVHKEIDRLLSGKEDVVGPRLDTSGDESDIPPAPDGRNTQQRQWQRQRQQNDPSAEEGVELSPEPGAAPDQASSEVAPGDSIHVRRHRHGPRTQRRFKLPRNFPRLLEVYYSYTHAWLPILNTKEALDSVAASYPPDGLDIDPEDSSGASAAHAELWCALAVGGFQVAASSRSSGLAGEVHEASSPSPSPERPSLIAAAARRLIPMEAEMALGHVKALLVLSLVKLGQDNAAAASLLIGLAVRGAMALTDRQSRRHGGRARNSISGEPTTPLIAAAAEPDGDNLDRVLMACLMLDTAVALGLGQTPHMRTSDMKDMPTDENGPEEWAPWMCRAGFGPEDVGGAVHPARSLSSFNQLYRFFRTLNQSVESGTATAAAAPVQIGAANLVQVLDPRFSFCNSVVFGASTIPKVPTAFLIQATFLGATLMLMAEPRVSLVWSLMEVLENSIAHFGAAGVSPLLVTYMSSIANTKSCVKALRDDDRARWTSLTGDLVSVWHDQTNADLEALDPDLDPGGREIVQAEPSDFQSSSSHLSSSRQKPQYPQFPMNTDSSCHQNGTGNGFLQAPSSASPSTARTMPFTPASQLDAFPTELMGHVSSAQAPYLMGHGAEGADYEAIMDELASIDCTDNMEADLQFMANLGFAPGSDLTDMIRGEFGGM